MKKYVLFGLIIFSSLTYAVSSQDSGSGGDIIGNIVQIFNLIFLLMTFLMTPAIVLAGWLLSPDWTMGDFFGLRPYFINIWILVSNLVYIAFALLLLGMAVMQIFWSESHYAFKKKLPRFLIGILIVPFTWLIVSWTLSFANQAVAAIMWIPFWAIESEQSQSGKKSILHLQTIPTEISLDFTKDAPWSIKCNDNALGQGTSWAIDTSLLGPWNQAIGVWWNTIKCISPAEFITKNDAGPFFMIMIYAYDIFKIQETNIADFNLSCNQNNAKECMTELGQMLQKFWVGLITTIFFGIIVISLCWVLLARAFKLWLYIMFSPLFGLAYALGDEWLWKVHESSWGGGGEWVSLGKVWFMPFFSLAMVPVLVSAVLSFGILFIWVINTTFSESGMESVGWGESCTKWVFMVKFCIKKTEQNTYTSKITIGESSDAQIVFQFWEMFSGLASDSTVQTAAQGAQWAAEASRDIFTHIILTLISLGILWMGIKAAVSSDEVTKMAFEPFAKFGDSVGHFVQEIPSYLPTPHPAFQAFDPAVWGTAGETLRQISDEHTFSKKKTLQDIMMNPGVREWMKDLKNAGDDMKRVAEILQENNTLWSSVWVFDPLNKSLEKGFKKIEGSKIEAVTASGKKLTVEKLQNEISSARDFSARSQIIAEYKPLIEKMGLSSDENVKNMAQVLLTNTSARSWTGVWKAFAGITIDPKTRTLTGLVDNPTTGVEVEKIKLEHLTPTQQQALKDPEIVKWLNGLSNTEKKAALDKLFDGLPDNPEEPIIKLLADQLKGLPTTTPSPSTSPTSP